MWYAIRKGRNTMTRQEFISQLRVTLAGKVSSATIQENERYYNEYIQDEIRKGKSEQEVLKNLGDPTLLAKSIIAAEDAGKQVEETVYDTENGTCETVKEQKKNGWFHKVLVILGVILAVVLVFTVVTGVIRFIAPFILPVLSIVLVFRIFSKRR